MDFGRLVNQLWRRSYKRRGLSGNFFFFIQDLTQAKLQDLVYYFQLILLLLFVAFSISILKDKKIAARHYLLFLSPLTFLFYYGSIQSIGRKEILIFVLFAAHILLLSKGFYNRITQFFILVCLTIISFFHEMTFFFVPYFVFAHYYFSGRKKMFDVRYLLYWGTTLLPLLSFIFWGTEINNGASIDILKERGVDIPAGWGIFYWTVEPIPYILNNKNSLIQYLPILLYGLLNIFFFFENEKRARKFIAVFLLFILYSLPLFLLAIDWGRWLFIHFMLITILLAGTLDKSKKWEESTISLVSLRPEIWIFVLLNLSISVSHCCSPQPILFEGILIKHIMQ